MYGKEYKRLKRRRAMTPTRQIYTGMNPVQRPERPQNNIRQPTSRTTTRELPEEQGGSGDLLAGVLAGKGAVSGIKDLYDDGQRVRKGVLSGYDTATDWASDAYTGMTDALTGTNTLTSLNQLPSGGADLMGQVGAGAVPGERALDMLGLNNPSLTVIDPTDVHGLYHTGIQVNPPPQVTDLATAGGTTFDDAGQSVVGMQNTGGVDKLGAAGSALGVGLNIHDMVDGGVNFGNVTGALGSGILGASALGLGAANAWNPVGWGLLGASAVDQLFDIF